MAGVVVVVGLLLFSGGSISRVVVVLLNRPAYYFKISWISWILKTV